MAKDRDATLTRLGRGIVQANARLSRVLELLEDRPPSPAPSPPAPPDPVVPALLDLLDAVRHASASPDDPLAIAHRQATRALAEHGLLPVATEGAHDPSTQRILGTVPADEAHPHGTLATTPVQGWVRAGTGAVYRHAQVTVHAAPEESS